MAFWSKERIVEEQRHRNLVEPFAEETIEQSAVALGVAPQYAITLADGEGARVVARDGECLKIPAGQFALLLTTERVSVPTDAIAFISMKAKFKLRGLINVSGFHVDPGFEGRLKFAVYNAGSAPVELDPNQRLFLIWYSDLDRETMAAYSGSRKGQDEITAADIMSIRGIVATPAGLSSRIDSIEQTLEHEISRVESKIHEHQNWSRPLLTALLVAIIISALGTFVTPWITGLLTP